MRFTDLELSGVTLIELDVFEDDRGFFRETYHADAYKKNGLNCQFVQDNHSYSKKAVLRGMHFQRKPGQDKLVSVIQGEIYDVVVDIRKDSPTYKKWIGVHLSEKNATQLFVPVGCAHGFYVLSETAHVSYKVSAFYHPEEEMGFRFDDPELAIQWPDSSPLLSQKDRSSPFLNELKL